MTITSTGLYIKICFFIILIVPVKAFCQQKCENLKNGQFYSYSEVATSESVYYRNRDTQKEIDTDTGDSSIWKIKWLDNCTYTLKLINGNNYTEQQISYLKQHLIVVKILEINSEYYTFESHADEITGKLILADTIWLERKSSLKNKSNWPITAYNDKGDKINLYEDGRWEMAKESEKQSSVEVSETPILLNNNKFIKDKSATYLVKSKKLNVGVYINPNKWGFSKGGINDPGEINFSMKEFDISASLITEKSDIPLVDLWDLIFENAQGQTSDAEVIKKEYRIVNGLKLLCMQMRLTIKGMRFIYFSYNFSNQNGTLQLSCVTNEILFKRNYQLIESFLNGLKIL